MKHLTLAAAFTLLAQPVLAQDKVSLILDWFVNPDHGPIIVAQEKGFFTDEGLEIEVVAPLASLASIFGEQAVRAMASDKSGLVGQVWRGLSLRPERGLTGEQTAP